MKELVFHTGQVDDKPSSLGQKLMRASHLFCSVALALVFLASVLGVPIQTDLIRSLATSLAHKGIGVRTKWSPKGAVIPNSPVLAPLRGFPADSEIGEGLSSFERLFNAGAFHEAALVAVEAEPGTPKPKPSEFLQLWNSTSPEKRIFISFTRDDAAAAHEVRVALEKQGYICFTYISGSNSQPWANSVQVGTFFRESAVQLVIDSPIARSSRGVQLEALALKYRNDRSFPPVAASYSHIARPEPTPRPMPRTEPTPRPLPKSEPTPRSAPGGSQPCCQLCHYRNGVLLYCDPVECGPQCKSATGRP